MYKELIKNNMTNQFFYTKVEGEKSLSDSFNINKVIRTAEYPEGTRLVLLDDLHERLEKVQQINPKSNKVVGIVKERNTFQSEILLSKEDNERFIAIFKN
jgi:hypothetical protein